MRRRLWRHILHTACQWGCTPLDSPLAGRHILHTSCQRGYAPLDSPLAGAKNALQLDSPIGAPHHPPGPLPGRKGEIKRRRLWRHILHTACQRGCAPLDSPLAGLRFNYGAHHPPGPLPGRKGEIKRRRVWRHILHTACQWGCTPLGLRGPLRLWLGPSPWPPSWKEGGNIIAKTGGHPQTPARGRRPLDSRFQDGGHLHTACQWGCTPLDSPLAG